MPGSIDAESSEEAELDRQIQAAEKRAEKRVESLQRLVEADLGISSVARKRALLAILNEQEYSLPVPGGRMEAASPGASPRTASGSQRNTSPTPPRAVSSPKPPAAVSSTPSAAPSSASLVPEAAGKGVFALPEPTGTAGEVLDKQALALALLARHSDWSNAQIARTVGVHPRTLYKWETFVKARAVMKSGRVRFPKGSKTEGRVEASAEDE